MRLEIRPVVSRHQKLCRLYSDAGANATLLLFSVIDMLQKTIFSVSLSVEHDDRRGKLVWPCLIRVGGHNATTGKKRSDIDIVGDGDCERLSRHP